VFVAIFAINSRFGTPERSSRRRFGFILPPNRWRAHGTSGQLKGEAVGALVDEQIERYERAGVA
jgi:hypothetical protein